MRLRVLSYNVHRAIGLDRRFQPERIVEILEHYRADIVLLQEVDRHAPRSGHMDLASYFARKLNYDYHAAGMNHFMRKGKYGNATLSRFAIGRQRNIDLTISWRKRRGAQHTRIMLPTPRGVLPLDVFNVHLGLSAGERAEQVRRLLATHDVQHLDPAHPCIIGGDMNDWRGLLWRHFSDTAAFACATNRGDGSRWALRTYPSFAPTGGLDKVFYRGGLKLLEAHVSRLRAARVASDHLPVIVDFEIHLPAAGAGHAVLSKPA